MAEPTPVPVEDTDQWRLGLESGEPDRTFAPDETVPNPEDVGLIRLRRPLFILTVERACWIGIALYTVASRLAALGARPLGPAEAANALAELKLANGPRALTHLPAIHSAWVHLVAGGLFGLIGAGDFSARLLFAISGIVMIATAFALRRYLGRAGAIGFAAMLLLSPSVTYYSRSNAPIVVAITMALATVVLFLFLCRRPTMTRAVFVGCASGLTLAADPSSLATTVFFTFGLIVLGLWQLLLSSHPYARFRLWLTRRFGMLAAASLAAIVLWVGFATNLFSRSILAALASNLHMNLNGSTPAGYASGLHFYLPFFTLYEFLIVIAAAAGILILLALRVRSRFAVWCLCWMGASLAFYLWTPARSAYQMVLMLVPMALVGALGVQYLYRTAAWQFIRYPLAALALLTLYVQFTANFAYSAPDVSQAPWARRALLYWSEPATTLQTRERCRAIRSEVSGSKATVFFGGGEPVLRWYLRDLTSTDREQSATVVAKSPVAAPTDDQMGSPNAPFDLTVKWAPQLGAISFHQAVKYLQGEYAFSPLDTRHAQILIRGLPHTGPVTPIVAPRPAVRPSEAATAPSSAAPTPSN